ncbi:MAG: DUF2958 domain-containing protein [Planctomycetota bacterium]
MFYKLIRKRLERQGVLNNWTWCATEYDPDERLFFGLVYGLEREWGYFSLDELESIKGPFGVGIERDRFFSPKPISQCSNPCGKLRPA